MKRMLICLMLVAAILSSGCKGDDSRSPAVRGIIMRYNQLLSEGYRSLNMNPLQEVATPEQATRLYYHMAALGEGKIRMDSTLKNIEFVRVAFPKSDEATVSTRETWDFAHLDIGTGKKVYEERDFVYEMEYSLKSANGRWIIYNVTTLGGKGAGK